MDYQELLDNTDGRMHGPMSGFIKRYFSNLQCDTQDATLPVPLAPSPDDFLQWFSNHVSREVDSARGSWQIPEPESDDDGARPLFSSNRPVRKLYLFSGNLIAFKQFYST